MDARGYSQRTITANAEAGGDSLGVLLGRYCISRDIPVSEVTEYFKVSRMTIYKWFSGTTTPRKKYGEKIRSMLSAGGW